MEKDITGCRSLQVDTADVKEATAALNALAEAAERAAAALSRLRDATHTVGVHFDDREFKASGGSSGSFGGHRGGGGGGGGQ